MPKLVQFLQQTCENTQEFMWQAIFVSQVMIQSSEQMKGDTCLPAILKNGALQLVDHHSCVLPKNLKGIGMFSNCHNSANAWKLKSNKTLEESS